MVNRLKSIGGRYFPPSNTFIFIVAAVVCCVLLIPNGIEPRTQRFVNMHVAAVFCMGLYAMRLNAWAGWLLVCSAAVMSCGAIDLPVAVVMFFAGVLFCFVVSGKISREAAYGAICIFALANVAWQILQECGVFYLLTPLPGFSHYRNGLMANSNDLAAFLPICLPCFLRRKWWLGVPAVLYGVYLCNSHGAILASGAVLILYALFFMNRWGRIISACFLAASLAWVLYYELPISRHLHLNDGSRMSANIVALDAWAYKPMGWGIGQFRAVFPLISAFNQLKPADARNLIAAVHDRKTLKRYIEDKRNADPNYFQHDKTTAVFAELHNEPLEWLFNAGPVAFILLVGGLLSILWAGFRARSLSFLGLFAASLTACWFLTWHIIPTAFLTVFYAADIVSEKGA